MGNARGKLVLGALAVVAAILIVALASNLFGQIGSLRGGAGDGSPGSSDSASEQGEKAAKPYSISFTSTGDLIFWREVGDYIDQNGGASAMANISDFLAQADVTIANVESPLSKDESEPITDKDVYIIGKPSAIESIENSGIDLASLANNHIMDYGKPALEDTLKALDGAGVLYAGAGLTENEAAKMAEMEVDGVSIAFFSWTDIVPDYFLAFGDEPGVVSARMNMADACKRVSEAKATHDIVIVAMHWGVEYEDYITDYLQSEPAHQLVDAGADVILGNHPHVIEGIEFYKGALIAYAHGNCVFWQKYDHTHESYLLSFDMTDEGVKNVVATPLYLDDKYGIPHFATGSQAQETLSRLEQISEGMNTAFDIRDGKAYITPIETVATGGVSANDASVNDTSAGNAVAGASAESASADGASASAASSDGNGA
ncbi:MAG: CapA family protein [Eggerthellaceae bacterium]|nr:CapA family protein [Eggerthellaceae bacterium]